jgi:hypothetical protein
MEELPDSEYKNESHEYKILPRNATENVRAEFWNTTFRHENDSLLHKDS